MRIEELYHIDMLEKDMELQLRLRRHQASTSSFVKGSSISTVATSSGFLRVQGKPHFAIFVPVLTT